MTDPTTLTAEAYFIDVATSVFDDYFRQLGARHESTDSVSSVRYVTDTWFAEILYLPSDGPNYLPRVEIGCLPEQFVDPRRNRVDVMHTAPENSEEHDYNLRWRYKSSQELELALTAVRDRILDVYTRPFLQDTKHLQMLLEKRNAIVEAAWTEEINEHNDSIWRADAEKAFKSGEYGNSIKCYNNIPPERRTRIDESKLRIAMRKNAE